MILIAAIAVGCIAAFVVLKYVNGIEDREAQDSQRVPVLVVRADIAQGTPGESAVEQGWVVEDEIAQEFLPATRITDLDQITGKIALNNLAANQVLVEGMFVDPAQTTVSAVNQRLEEDHVAYTISVDQTAGVAGLLVPGDLVNILVTSPEGEGGGEDGGGDTGTSLFSQNARVLYQQVRILAIGTQTAPTAGEQAATEGAEADAAAAAPVTSGLLTLDLPIEAAQIVASIPSGSIRLTLTGPDYTARPLPEIDLGDLSTLPGEDGDQLTPYGPDGPQ
jgi:pilus assembly protein CpaB